MILCNTPGMGAFLEPKPVRRGHFDPLAFDTGSWCGCHSRPPLGERIRKRPQGGNSGGRSRLRRRTFGQGVAGLAGHANEYP